MHYPPYPLTKFARRTIMVCLIVTFFIVSPITILYTAGYRYDWQTKQVHTTGVLSVDVFPEDVKVYVNDSLMPAQTPLRVTNLKPGPYQVRIEKNGYKTWEKDMLISSNRTTYIKDITLVKESLPIAVSSLSDEHIKLSPHGTLSVTYSDSLSEPVTLLSFKDNGQHQLQIEGETLSHISWSPFEEAALIVSNDTDVLHGYILTIQEPENPVLFQNIGEPKHWNRGKNPAIFLQSDTQIEQLDPKGRTLLSTVSSSVWYVDSNSSIWEYDAETKALSSKKEKLAFSLDEPITEIIDVNDKRIVARTQNGISVIRPYHEKRSLHIPTHNVFYNTATREWIAWSAWELWSIYEDGSAVLLNRTGNAIESVRPLDNFGELLLVADNKLTAFNPGYYFSQNLFQAENIEDVSVNKKLRKIFFVGTVAGKRGLYELEY